VSDLVFRLAEPFPEAVGIYMRFAWGRKPPQFVPWDMVLRIDPDAVIVRAPANGTDFPPFVDQMGWIMLEQHLMGRTILDIDGRETEVVNDVHLLEAEGDPSAVDALVDALERRPPPLAVVESVTVVSAPITGATGSYARGHGNISLAANTVSGILCQVDRVPNHPDRLIIMTVEHHLVYHSHSASMWGFPGNIMKIVVRVQRSTDPECRAGTLGNATLFASYNGVRSDSVRFSFPAACKDHDHLYHGPQVNNQVPPA